MYFEYFKDYILPEKLDEDELKEAFLKINAGDISFREKIIKHNLRLVYYRILKRFSYTGIENDEMFSLGVEGLIKAVDNYKLEKMILD